MDANDNLWMVSNGTNVSRYAVNARRHAFDSCDDAFRACCSHGVWLSVLITQRCWGRRGNEPAGQSIRQFYWYGFMDIRTSRRLYI